MDDVRVQAMHYAGCLIRTLKIFIKNYPRRSPSQLHNNHCHIVMLFGSSNIRVYIF